MYYNEPLPIALDREVTIDMTKLAAKGVNTPDTQVILRTDGNTVSFVISDYFADMPPVDVKTHFFTGANGTSSTQSYWIRLNLTAREFYEKLKFENDPESEVFFIQTEERVYVNVLLGEKGLYISIQTAHKTVYEGGPAQS